jgi:hypothetical protein
VRGLGVTEAALLSGLLDGPLNEALDVDPERGFRGNWVTGLANLVGLTPVPLVIRELRAEVGALDAQALRLPGTTVVRDGDRPGTLLPCSSASPTSPSAASARAAGAPVAGIGAARAVDRLRRVPALRNLPDARSLAAAAARPRAPALPSQDDGPGGDPRDDRPQQRSG